MVKIFNLFLIVVALSASSRAFTAEQPPEIPAWLAPHVGEGEGQIAPVVLQRARALYLQKLHAGAIKNPCYFAMDATRPHDPGGGKLGSRFYVICESDRSFRAISSGHGSGRANFVNGKRCAKNFSNAMDSRLTAGGPYVTAETRTSFKGYYRAALKQDAALIRSFVQFEGEGEAANAREREIGGHAAALLRNICRRKDPHSPHADQDGYVKFGQLEDYTTGRSNGCTSWSRPDAEWIVAMVKDDPTTLYIYPESTDIDAVAEAVKARRPLSPAGLYWNASCLKEIGAPKFWSKKAIEPPPVQPSDDRPALPPRPLPICKGLCAGICRVSEQAPCAVPTFQQSSIASAFTGDCAVNWSLSAMIWLLRVLFPVFRLSFQRSPILVADVSAWHRFRQSFQAPEAAFGSSRARSAAALARVRPPLPKRRANPGHAG